MDHGHLLCLAFWASSWTSWCCPLLHQSTSLWKQGISNGSLYQIVTSSLVTAFRVLLSFSLSFVSGVTNVKEWGAYRFFGIYTQVHGDDLSRHHWAPPASGWSPSITLGTELFSQHPWERWGAFLEASAAFRSLTKCLGELLKQKHESLHFKEGIVIFKLVWGWRAEYTHY